jgi:hypothetical protein
MALYAIPTYSGMFFSTTSCHLEEIVQIFREANAIHILLRISAINMALRTAIFLPSRMKKRKNNPVCRGRSIY